MLRLPIEWVFNHGVKRFEGNFWNRMVSNGSCTATYITMGVGKHTDNMPLRDRNLIGFRDFML